MKIAIDVSPIEEKDLIKHRVRGVGFYINNLKRSLIKYFSENKYTFFTRGEKLPKDIDLVHYPYFDPFFLTLPIFSKYKTVVTVHDLTPLVFPKYFPRGIKGELKWQIQKMLLKKIDAIIADSECSKNDIVKYAGISPEKILVIYLAATENFGVIKNTLLLDRIRVKYRLPDRFVLYVGDVTWNKNLPRLIEAIKKTNIPLVMVGKALVSEDFDRKNPWNQDLVTVHNNVKEDKNIILPGFVETADLVQIYNLATFFIMPSLYEGFGLPFLEARACVCPVITTKEGSIPGVAGDAAIASKIGSPN